MDATSSKRLLSYVRRAVEDYNMIRPNDVIAVGVSGGKDSLSLLYALAQLRRFYPVPFYLTAITVDMGFPGTDYSRIQALCAELNVPYHIVPTEISRIIFDVRKEKNPCSLCSKMRRGALHKAAKSLGCTAVALGHHFDDVVDTFMLNLFFEGRLGCFQPVTYLSRSDLYVIRPLLYLPEKDIRYFTSRASLPVVPSACPANGNTERAAMKELLTRLEKDNKGLRYRIFGAIQRGKIDGFHETGRMTGIKAYADPEEEDGDTII